MKLLFFSLLIPLLFALNLTVGSVDIPLSAILRLLGGEGAVDQPVWHYIVMESRLPQALTALLAGSGLGVSGLLLQTLFRNPLADPSIFGISSGSSLGVAMVVLWMGGSMNVGSCSLSGTAAILAAALTGAVAVMVVILFFSSVVRGHAALLIVGIMIGYLASSAISLLNFFATEEGVHSYMIWGLGNFGGVSMSQIPLFTIVSLIGLGCSILLIKPLNAVLLGEQYAENLGINTLRLRNLLLLVTGLLTAITTAFCGPISFIGLAVPHIARLVLNTDDHRSLIPGTIIAGAIVALLCNMICVLPGEQGIIPLNAVTPVMGAPVIIYVLCKGKRKK